MEIPDKMIGKISWCLLLSALSVPQAGAQGVDHKSKEYSFFRSRFERVNGGAKEKELNETFDAIFDAVKEIQRSSPNVTLRYVITRNFRGWSATGIF